MGGWEACDIFSGMLSEDCSNKLACKLRSEKQGSQPSGYLRKDCSKQRKPHTIYNVLGMQSTMSKT